MKSMLTNFSVEPQSQTGSTEKMHVGITHFFVKTTGTEMNRRGIRTDLSQVHDLFQVAFLVRARDRWRETSRVKYVNICGIIQQRSGYDKYQDG